MGDPDGRPRNDDGQYADRIPPEAVLEVFDERTDLGRPLTASDVMEAVDCSRRTAHNKLETLVDRGRLKTRKVGARSRVWWVPMERGTDHDHGDDGRPLAVANAIEEASLPGSGPTLEARRAALSAAYDYLAANPEAKKADFLRDVYHDHPAGYESAESWWNAIQPALKGLPGVDPPAERGHLWHFLGGD
ncbi:ArsR family transcriptional regulator [Haloplanus litoreus]|uniref:ArsR family transcriptional regulator n=1 Tax=Haloplanus litoreus TaxID=767515 RepID=A0ABD5ZX94_9EURY